MYVIEWEVCWWMISWKRYRSKQSWPSLWGCPCRYLEGAKDAANDLSQDSRSLEPPQYKTRVLLPIRSNVLLKNYFPTFLLRWPISKNLLSIVNHRFIATWIYNPRSSTGRKIGWNIYRECHEKNLPSNIYIVNWEKDVIQGKVIGEPWFPGLTSKTVFN
jgi:hypothetical protein